MVERFNKQTLIKIKVEEQKINNKNNKKAEVYLWTIYKYIYPYNNKLIYLTIINGCIVVFALIVFLLYY